MLATPGADIDAAELLEVDVVVATLTACSLASQSPCKNDLADAENAQGPPDNDYYFNTTSLNGGTLRCRWSGGEALTLGRTVRVIEIGGVDAAITDPTAWRNSIAVLCEARQLTSPPSGKAAGGDRMELLKRSWCAVALVATLILPAGAEAGKRPPTQAQAAAMALGIQLPVGSGQLKKNDSLDCKVVAPAKLGAHGLGGLKANDTVHVVVLGDHEFKVSAGGRSVTFTVNDKGAVTRK